MASEERAPYDHRAHLRTIKTKGQGEKPYLPVYARVLWLRAVHPDALIVTEKVDGGVEAGWVEFKATITYGDAGGATGHGSETKGDFADFYEKAETKAIGRALAALGFGTEASTDFDDGEPLDGAGAAKAERIERRGAPPPAAPAPPTVAPSSLPARRGVPAAQRAPAQEPNGRELAWNRLIAKMDALAITTGGVTTLSEAAEAIDATAAEREMGVRVRRGPDGTPAIGDLMNALLAFGPVR